MSEVAEAVVERKVQHASTAKEEAAAAPEPTAEPATRLRPDNGASAKGYLAGGAEYFYPEDGDIPPPGGADVHLLTIGGICVRGTWSNDGRYLGWAPLPKANHEREARIREKRMAEGKRRFF